MKKEIFTIVLCLCTLIAGCQNTEKTDKNTHDTTEKAVPDAVQRSFELKYPGEDDPDWHRDSNNNFEANFKIDGEKYRADFSPDGSWIETENTIKKKNLPQAVKDVIKEKYSDQEITEVERVDHAIKGIFFDVEFKREGKNLDIEFKEDGSIINK